MGLRVIVSDDLAPTSTNYPVYFFTQGAIASGEQMGMQTETDRDILAKSDAMSIDLHYCLSTRLALSGRGYNQPNTGAACHHRQLD
jgi:hypothetical protein